MKSGVALTTIGCALVLLLSGPLLAATSSETAPKEVAAVALDYTQALVRGDMRTSWNLLSAASRAANDIAHWEASFATGAASRPPAPNAILKALATANPPATANKTLVLGSEALIEVKGSVEIGRTVVLVKEGNRWLVDLAASDEVNSQEAAQTFLEAIADDAGVSAQRPVRTPQTSLPMLRTLLAPEAKDYRVSQTEMRGDRAYVTVVADLPVTLVLRAKRQGPGWQVDLARPLVTTNPTSADPLNEAVGSIKQSDCQDQLRRLGQAIQMYSSLSEDLLPDPDRWIEQIRPYLSGPPALHCPADATEGVSYAMNRNLAGKKRSEIGNPAMTPLLYESSLHTANPADRGESWQTPTRHADGNMVLYVDGSVRPSEQPPSFTPTAFQPAGARGTISPRRPITPRPSRPGVE